MSDQLCCISSLRSLFISLKIGKLGLLVSMHAPWCLCGGQRTTCGRESVLSFRCMGLGSEIQVVRFAVKYVYVISQSHCPEMMNFKYNSYYCHHPKYNLKLWILYENSNLKNWHPFTVSLRDDEVCKWICAYVVPLNCIFKGVKRYLKQQISSQHCGAYL